MRYLQNIKEEFSSTTKPVFNVNELKIIKGLSAGYRRLLIHNLLKRGLIAKITRGIYTFHQDMVVLCFAFSPSYYGLEDALRIRGLSMQGTNPIVITPKNVRMGLRTFLGANYLVYRMKPELFFGYGLVKRDGFWVPVSDLEKTIIDMLYFGGAIRDELWQNILPGLDSRRLNSYLEKYKPAFRRKVRDTLRDARKLPKERLYAKSYYMSNPSPTSPPPDSARA